MSLEIHDVARKAKFVTLNDGNILSVNGYMLESIDKKQHYPLIVYFTQIVFMIALNGELIPLTK